MSLDFVQIDQLVWLPVLLLLVAMGIYLTLRLKGFQISCFGEMVRCSVRQSGKKDSVSQFQAFCISMGQHIGVGNVSGPILAILLGGPGQIFWMWIFTFLAMAPTFIESTLGQLFKVRGKDGFRGGLPYYIRNGIGKKRLCMVVAFLIALTYGIGFISVQQSSASMAFCSVFEFQHNNVLFAVAFASAVSLFLYLGARRVIKALSKVIPVMTFQWIGICILTIILIPHGAVTAFGSIFAYAFQIPAVLGGSIGTILAVGMSRSLFQHEGGIGTTPTLTSMADIEHPARSGLSQQFGVALDIMICTFSALTVLSIGSFDYIYSLGLESVPLIIHVFGTVYGNLAQYIIIIFLTVFQTSCTLSELINQGNNLEVITEQRGQKTALYLVQVMTVFVSAIIAEDRVTVAVDFFLQAVQVANIYALWKLHPLALRLFRDYREQRRNGIREPVFDGRGFEDVEGITCWGPRRDGPADNVRRNTARNFHRIVS